MQTLLVDLILVAALGAIFLIARRGYWNYARPLSDNASGTANFFGSFWGWADYKPKDWSSASYKRASLNSPKTIRMRHH